MDFLDDYDEPRPRFLVSRGDPTTTSPAISGSPTPSILHLFACFAAAALLLGAAYSLAATSQTLATLSVWFASSLLLAPFAPVSATGGPTAVGRGSPLPDPVGPSSSASKPEDPRSNHRNRRGSARSEAPKGEISKPDLDSKKANASGLVKEGVESKKDEILKSKKFNDVIGNGDDAADCDDDEESEWTGEELDLLKRQMAKHPAGEPQRWEKIAGAFGGRRSQESVIRAAKSGDAANNGDGNDSFKQFLRRRKPLDPRATEAIEAVVDAKEREGDDWSSGDDLALLNALKAFPKDSNMRWEKITAAVPGKTKAACMKRVAELKRDFRSSKTTESSS